MNASREIILIRHAEVDPKFKSICYGSGDVPLSESGTRASINIADEVTRRFAPRLVFHSGLSRTKFLARMIADRSVTAVQLEEDRRVLERDYGDWQGQSWDDAYASDPDNFHNLIEKPDTYRPPNGETTTEMQLRMIDWYREVSQSQTPSTLGPIIVVSHSGPITALIGAIRNLTATQWQPWLPKYLEGFTIQGGIVSRIRWASALTENERR